jgi:ssDNA thymidine ADP-ribosyltransferase, DarT
MRHTLEETLSPEKALIFRITHRANLLWTLRNGLHCGRSELRDHDFVSIGNVELIQRRSLRRVAIPPGGTLDEYIPFYFTPFTPMLYNIKTGYGGIRRRPNEEIVILVSSLIALEGSGVQFIFTDRHAYLEAAQFFSDRADLSRVDYGLLRRRDFRRDPEDPGKVERYQAEALVHRSMPVSALLGVACYAEQVARELEAEASELDLNPKIVVRPDWYF